jgi:hypothetical protein
MSKQPMRYSLTPPLTKGADVWVLTLVSPGLIAIDKETVFACSWNIETGAWTIHIGPRCRTYNKTAFATEASAMTAAQKLGTLVEEPSRPPPRAVGSIVWSPCDRGSIVCLQITDEKPVWYLGEWTYRPICVATREIYGVITESRLFDMPQEAIAWWKADK